MTIIVTVIELRKMKESNVKKLFDFGSKAQ